MHLCKSTHCGHYNGGSGTWLGSHMYRRAKTGNKKRFKFCIDRAAANARHNPANNKINNPLRSAATIDKYNNAKCKALEEKKEELRQEFISAGASISPTLTSSGVSDLALRIEEKIRSVVKEGQLFYVFTSREYRFDVEGFMWCTERSGKGSQLLSNLDGSPFSVKKLKELGWKLKKLHTCSNSSNVNNTEMALHRSLNNEYGSLWKECGKGGVHGEGQGFDFCIGVAYGDVSDEMIINEKAANRHGIPIKKTKKGSSAKIDSFFSAKKSK
ncbi:hypothetical protein TrCOL_g5570 [Triparma columacea]|uniref:Uncharacterized protein n=1 Tax=Triparma columacea TaxID=722753 RepID=A0A9W7L326_9STRA|nr:hypothetical protein TrCOL_g5570 [Triparma columacea]